MYPSPILSPFLYTIPICLFFKIRRIFNSLVLASGKITSLLLKIANGTTHGDETWYTCVLHHFHDDCRLLTVASGTFLVACIEVKLGPLVQNA